MNKRNTNSEGMARGNANINLSDSDILSILETQLINEVLI